MNNFVTEEFLMNQSIEVKNEPLEIKLEPEEAAHTNDVDFQGVYGDWQQDQSYGECIASTSTGYNGFDTQHYTCNQCGQIFDSDILWQHHLNENNCTVSCHLCTMSFETIWHLEQHNLAYHNGAPVINMDVPEIETITTYDDQQQPANIAEFTGIEEQLQPDLTKIKYENPAQPEGWHCKQCRRSFSKRGYYLMHMKYHMQAPESAKKWAGECEKCGQKFRYHSNLIRHAESQICAYELMDEVNAGAAQEKKPMTKYSAKSTLKKRIGCAICRIYFRTYYQVHKHNEHFQEYHKLHGGLAEKGQRRTYRNVAVESQGIETEKESSQIETITDDIVAESGPVLQDSLNSTQNDVETKVEPNDTTQLAMRRRKRRTIVTTKYVNLGNGPLSEDVIKEKRYTLEQIFRSHRVIDGRYRCRICARSIVSKQNFVAHLRGHTGEYVAQCRICGKGFTRGWLLAKHQKACALRKLKLKQEPLNSDDSNSVSNEVSKKLRRNRKRLILYAAPSIGDIPLSEDIIRENKYTLDQVFRSHSVIEDHYECKVCGRHISAKQSFIAHLRMHTGDYVSHCKYCSKGFTRKWHLDTHQKTCGYKKPANNTGNDQSASVSVFTPKYYRRPRTIPVLDGPDIGDIPLSEEIIRANRYTVEQIFRTHQTIDDMYHCKICGKAITTKDSFKAHLRRHTGEFVVRCQFCNKGFTRQQHVKPHEKTCQQEVEMERAIVGIHIKREPVDGEMSSTPILNTRRRRRKRNAYSGSGLGSFVPSAEVIPLTDEMLKENKFTLEQLFRSHAQIDDGHYECRLCGKKITTKDSFIAHLRRHTGDYIGHCKFCGKGFTRPWHLQSHQRQCETSPRRFSASRKVIRQAKSDFYSLGDIPLTDEIIKQNKYTVRQVLACHTLTDGIFKCKICEKVVSNKQSLKCHLRTHTGEYVANCRHCGKGFTRSWHCTGHEVSCLKKKKRKRAEAAWHPTPKKPSSFVDIGDVPLNEEIIKANKYTVKQIVESHKQIDGYYECKLCGTLHHEKVDLIAHLKEHMESWQTEDCRYCGEKFPSEKKCKKHEKKCVDNYVVTSEAYCRKLRQRKSVDVKEEPVDDEDAYESQSGFSDLNLNRNAIDHAEDFEEMLIEPNLDDSIELFHTGGDFDTNPLDMVLEQNNTSEFSWKEPDGDTDSDSEDVKPIPTNSEDGSVFQITYVDVDTSGANNGDS